LKKKKKAARAGAAKAKKSSSGKGARSGSGSASGIEATLRTHVIDLLKGGSAHVQFMDALEEFPPQKRGTFAPGLPHTGWQLLEHARIAQWDIMEFSRNPKHVSPGFPEGYWPKTPGPLHDADWDKSVQQFQHDLVEMIEMVKSSRTDLFAKIPHGDGQTVLRQALVLADHNAYHLGQLVDLRRALGAWPHD
jgi:hypothetical protein